jgi:hypothetical protein
MSIEQIIQDNTAALVRLTEALLLRQQCGECGPKTVAAAVKPVAAAVEPVAAAVEPVAAAVEPVAAAVKPIEYSEVRAAILKHAAAHKPTVVSTMAKYGAKIGTEIKVEDYAAFLRDLESAVAQNG